MGEQLRSHIAACQAVHLPHCVVDIFRYAARADPDHMRTGRRATRPRYPQAGSGSSTSTATRSNSVQKAFADRQGDFADGYNIIVPAWELPRYPEVWAKQLRKFDEVWALSHFIADALAAAGIPSTHIGQAVEVPLGPLLPRRYFGIRESAFTLLHFFDLTSYATRKNPDAVLECSRCCAASPVRGHPACAEGEEGGDGRRGLAASDPRAPAGSGVSGTAAECAGDPQPDQRCDCFVSLHRSEGFGRGTGEAMFLGRLALATGWSGNLDYMTEENSLLRGSRLVPVGADEYPHGEGQVWAEPDLTTRSRCWKGHRRSGAGARHRRAGQAGHPAGPWLPGRRFSGFSTG